MTREEREQALEWFKNRPVTMSGAKKMYDLAISALEQPEPCEDTISRQAAIDALAKFVPYAICDASTESYTNGLTDAYNLICQLPSVQSEQITCKDCNHCTFNAGAKIYCDELDMRMYQWDYCSRAERRKDGTTN